MGFVATGQAGRESSLATGSESWQTAEVPSQDYIYTARDLHQTVYQVPGAGGQELEAGLENLLSTTCRAVTLQSSHDAWPHRRGKERCHHVCNWRCREGQEVAMNGEGKSVWKGCWDTGWGLINSGRVARAHVWCLKTQKDPYSSDDIIMSTTDEVCSINLHLDYYINKFFTVVQG